MRSVRSLFQVVGQRSFKVELCVNDQTYNVVNVQKTEYTCWIMSSVFTTHNSRWELTLEKNLGNFSIQTLILYCVH